ncbi:hypothetical protein HWB79_gp113 [Streptomyces phage LukeCage]|jgi:hypothetical protein|uniref:Uncharacterized protein n=1 Tax=Streptomyces phage LukeCage TaxID=2283304 RepID=A0A345MGL7_9CAUD|nr:hypothetical protein HWB79_gp113 [Streptomyces phage LukeCage]AXH69698.1 hypothetical protein SEA_LUKECAGE_211 [Streptomyces phage LukeCage]
MEIVGIIAVTLIFGYLALIGIAINFIPAEMNAYQRLIALAWSAAWVWLWWIVVGSDIHVTVN